MTVLHRVPRLKDSMGFLKKSGFDISYIVDIGVSVGTPWLQKHFNNAHYVLIEPDPIHNTQIEHNYRDYSYEIINTALGSSTGTAKLNLVRDFVDEQGVHIGHEVYDYTCEITTLDSLNLQPQKYSLLKIDTDGYELDIIQGAQNTISKFDILVIEAKLCNIKHIIDCVDNEFYLWDIANLDYNSGHMNQVDLVFKHNRIQNEGQQPQGYLASQYYRQGLVTP